MTTNRKAAERTACTRCGTCCRKGGASLHGDDLAGIKTGNIPPEKLYTLRAGELIRDNINGGLITLPAEIIKIKSRADSDTCVYFHPENSACAIYENRPAQCQAMKCWDTAEIVRLYGRDRLDRAAVFSGIPWLMELIGSHEARCGYGKIRELVARRESGDSSAGEALSALIAFDRSLREVVREKDARAGRILDLLFGRPLSITIPRQFGISVKSII